MPTTQIEFEIDHKFIKRIMFLAKVAFYLGAILNAMTFGLMRKRIEYQNERICKIVSEAVAESITVK